jgi:hypothetical protein
MKRARLNVEQLERRDMPASILVNVSAFQDTDADGVRDPGEPGLAGVQVSVLRNGISLVGTVRTGADGTARWVTHQSGFHRFQAATPAGLTPSTPAVVDQVFIGWEQLVKVEFGFAPPAPPVPPPPPARGQIDVWVYDADGLGVPGVIVTLFRDGQVQPVAEVITSDGVGIEGGSWLVPVVGSYTVTITVPDGWEAITPTTQAVLVEEGQVVGLPFGLRRLE